MASNGEQLLYTGLVAAADLSAKQYYAVKLASTAGQVKVVSSCLDVAIGILQNDPTAGQPASVAFAGQTKAHAGPADVAAGEYLTYNTTGQVEDTTTATRRLIGLAVTASGTANDLIEIILNPGNRY